MYCSNCGSKTEGKFCSNCGKEVVESNVVNSQTNQLNPEMTEYFKQKLENKKNHNGYRLASGIVMIVLGAVILLAAITISDALDKTGYRSLSDMYLAYRGLNITFVFTLPGLLILAGGILSIVSRKNNTLLLISGIAYLTAAIINMCAISDISILFILCCVFGPINLVFYSKSR